MSYTYSPKTQKRRGDAVTREEGNAPARPALDALRSGAAQPTAEQMGRRVDLPDAMREKMENAFGADLSGVKLYESEAVEDAGAEAVTRGSDIAFAPGMLDFSSYGGQALLGHELSHVVSQARGEVTGGGFLNDRALEARADREGAMAAAGQTIAMPTAALSSATVAPAAGPMQAKKNKKDDWSWAEDPKEQRPAPSPGAVWLSDLYPLGASLPAIDEEETVQQPLAAEEADASDLDVDDPEFNLPAALPASVPEEAIDPDDYDDGDDAIDGGVAIHAEDYDDGADGDDLDDDWDDGRRKLSPGAVRLSDLYPSGDPYADADEAVPLSALAEEGDVSGLDVPDFSFTNYKGQPAAPGPARVEDDEIGINDYDTDDDYAEAPPAQDQAATVAQLQDQIRQLREQLAQKDALIAKLMAGRA